MKLPSFRATDKKHRFSEVPEANIERSKFDRSHSYKTTFDPDYLIPFYIDEVLPGDTFNVKTSHFIRMTSPLNKPIMDNMYLDTFYFFVPLRLIWTNFVKFMGEQDNPADSVSYTVPQVVADGATGFTIGSLSDYFGLPTGVNSLSVCSFWHRAYNLCWNQWFRDENIQNSLTVDMGNGPDTITNYILKQRGKRHDYFTSALPWTQKGTAVTAAISGNAPVSTAAANATDFAILRSAAYIKAQTDTTYLRTDGAAGTAGNYLYADLASASGLSINALRLAFQTQKMLERDARGGTRYTELIKSHFKVTSPDARLQRAEFLGGRSNPIQINPVPQTAPTTAAGNNLGQLGAFALGTNTLDGFVKSFTEHGVILGLCMVRADLTYQQGLDKMFSRSTRLDFFFPALAHLGEQTVLTKEIYCDGSGNDALAFGYQERFAEYRYARSKITGKLRSTAAGTLEVWHLAQKFTSYPTLSDTFIKETMPITRVEFVTTEPAFVMDCFVQNDCVRPMPVYSVPGDIDRF